MIDKMVVTDEESYKALCEYNWHKTFIERNFVMNDVLTYHFCRDSYKFYMFLACNTQCDHKKCSSIDLQNSACVNPKICLNKCLNSV